MSPCRIFAARGLRDWPAGRAVAGVNSFGFGGANAHVLLEAAPDRAALPSEELDEAGPQLFVLTARSEAALQRLASLHLRRLRRQ